MIEYEKLDTYSIDDCVAAFHQIYGPLIARTNRDAASILLHVVEHASEIQEDLRIGRFYNALDHLADAFCWTCSLVLKSADTYHTDQSYNRLILLKFPELCYHCAHGRCVCSTLVGPAIEDPEEKLRLKHLNAATLDAARQDLKEKGVLTAPQSMKHVTDMFAALYSHLNFTTPLEYTVAHLQEEVGEVAECINNLDDGHVAWKSEVELELPDLFVWTTALLMKLDYVLGSTRKYFAIAGAETPDDEDAARKMQQTARLTLPMVLWNRYGADTGVGLICPRCRKSRCQGTEASEPRKMHILVPPAS